MVINSQQDIDECISRIIDVLADVLDEIKALYDKIYAIVEDVYAAAWTCPKRFCHKKTAKKFFFWVTPFKKIRPTARSSI